MDNEYVVEMTIRMVVNDAKDEQQAKLLGMERIKRMVSDVELSFLEPHCTVRRPGQQEA